MGSASEADLALIRAVLVRIVRRYRGIDAAEAEDIIHDVLLSVLERAGERHARPSSVERPGAYLITAARNRVLDRLRRSYRRDLPLAEEDEGDLALDDDYVAAILDAHATAMTVNAAMRRAVEVGDHVAVRVAATWLDLAETWGTPPASRQVAQRAAVSHTTVNKALNRLRSYFPRESGDPSARR